MRKTSSITDPEELVNVYWDGVDGLLPINDYISVSRRNIAPPEYLITRSSRFTEDINPWTQRNRLPRCSGGIMGEVAYANRPMIIDDLAARLREDDPVYPYLHGFDRMIALPSYDNGEALNMTGMLLPPGEDFDMNKLPMIHWHGSLFGRGTQNLVLRNQLSAALARLDRELEIVGSIQRSLLPRELPKIEGVDVAACYETSARAGGDYYDFFPLSDGCWGIFIADVSGHGTPAAVLMAITHAIAHSQPGSHTPPQDLLTYLNRELSRSYTSGGTFVTAFYGVYDPRTRTLACANAGHPPPRILRGGEVIAMECAPGLPLGIMDDEVFGQSVTQLQRGDLIVLFTDGLTEAMAPMAVSGSRELFGFERLDEFLRGCKNSSARKCLDDLCDAVDLFTQDADPADDQTVIAMRVV